MTTPALPKCGVDIFKFTPMLWLRFRAMELLARTTSFWRFPIKASGEFDQMRTRDIVYWLYKARYPITRAVRDSGLEELFARQDASQVALPVGFQTDTRTKVSAVGDLMDNAYLGGSAFTLYRDVADAIFDADISMANLECVISPDTARNFEFTLAETPPLAYSLAHFDVARGIGSRQFKFFATANNHSYDCGAEGLQTTLDVLKTRGILHNGTNRSLDDSKKATIIESNRIRVGVIAHTFGINGKQIPDNQSWMVNRTNLNADANVDLTLVEQQLNLCRRDGVDIVVAHLHWGLEHEFYPRPGQVALAHLLAEMGVDVIIGHHAHVVQPTEFYITRRDPNRVVPIFYSLGNVISPFQLEESRRSTLASLVFAKGKRADGTINTYVESVHERSLFMHVDSVARSLRLGFVE